MGLRIRGGRRGNYGGEKPMCTPRVSSRGRRIASGSRNTNARRLSPSSHVTPRSVAERRKRNEELNQSILKTLDHLLSVDQEEKFCRDIQSELEKTVQDFDADPINISFKDKDKGFSNKARTEGSALEVSVNGVLKLVNGSTSKSSEDVERRSILDGGSVLNHSGEMRPKKQLHNVSTNCDTNGNTGKIAHSSTVNGVHALEPRMFYLKENKNGKNTSKGLNQRRVASMGQQKCYKYFNKLSKRNRINYSKKSSDWNPGISKVSRTLGKDIKTTQILDEDLKKNGRLSNERSPKKCLNLRGSGSSDEMASCPGTSSGNQVITTGDMNALPMILRNSSMAPNSDSEKDDEEEDEEGLVHCSVARSKNGVKEMVDVIDGIEFVTFENEHDMVQFTRLVSDESGKGDGVDLGFSAEFPEAIVPKKTKDIKKIKGWQRKKFTVTQNPMVDSSVSGSESLALNDLHPDGIEYEHNYIQRQLEKEDYLVDSEDELPDLTVANLADIQGDKKIIEAGLVGQSLREKMCQWKPSEKSAFVSFSSSNSDQIGKSRKEVTVECNDESVDVLDYQIKVPKKLTSKDQSELELQKDHPSLRSIVALSPTSILMTKMRRQKQIRKDKVLKVCKAVQTDLPFGDGVEKRTRKKRNWKVKTLEDELREWSRPFPDIWHVDENRASFAVSAVKPLKWGKKIHANPLQNDRSQGRHPKRVLRRLNFSQGEGRESTSQTRLLRSSTKARPPPVRITRSSICASQTAVGDIGPASSSPVKCHNSRRSTGGTASQVENFNSRVSESELQIPDETASSQSSLLKSWQRLPFENGSSKKSLIRILPWEKLIDNTLLDISSPDSSQTLGSSSLETLDQPTNCMMASKKLDQPTCSGVESKSLKRLDQAASCGIVSESSKLSDQPSISAVGSESLKAMDQTANGCVETECSKTQDQPTNGKVGSDSSETSDQPTSVVGISIPSADSESVTCSLSKNSALPEPGRNTHSKSNFAAGISRKARRRLQARKMWIIRKMRKVMEKSAVDSFKGNQPQIADVGNKEQLIVDAHGNIGGAEAASGEEIGEGKLVQPENMAKGENVRKRFSDGKIEDGISRRTNSPSKALSEKLKKPFQRKDFSLEMEDEDLRVFLKPKPRLQVGAFSPAKSLQDPSMHASSSTSRSEANHPSELSPPKKTDVEIFKSKSPNSPALARRRLIRELQKLNANFVSVDPEEKSSVNEKCSKEFCRLGCVCDSLRTDKRLVEHCGKVECMFSCVCPSTESASSSAKQLVIGSDTVSRLQEESSRHMARVEKFFHHTVVEAAGELVLPGRQQRERRLPKRFLDESVHPDEIFAKKTKTQDSSGKSTVHQAKKDIPSPSSAQYKKCCVSLGQFPNLQASVRCIYHSRLNCPCLNFKAPSGVRRNVAMKSTSKVREKQSVPIRGSAFALSVEEISALSQNKKNIPATKTLDSLTLENQYKVLSLKVKPGFPGGDAENNDTVISKGKERDVVGQNMSNKVLEKLGKEDASDKDCYCKDVSSDHYCEGNEHLHSVRTCGIALWATQLPLEKLVSKDIVKVSDLNNVSPNLSKGDSPTLPAAESGFKSVHSLLNKVHQSVPQASEGKEKSAPKSVDTAAKIDVEAAEKYLQDVPQESTANNDNDSDLSELVRQDDSMPLFKIVEVKSLPPSSFESEQNTSAEHEKKRAIHKMKMDVPKTENGVVSDSKKDLALKKKITKKKARAFPSIEKFNKWLKSNRTMCGDLEKMCSKSLKPLPLNSTILVKWSHLSKLVDSHSAHLWIRQRLNPGAPVPNSHIFVTQNDRPPDGACVNFLDLEKKVALCAKVAILLRAAKLGEPKAMGCGILVSKGVFWEITGHIKFGKRMRKDLHDLELKNEVPGGSSSSSGEKDVLAGESGIPSDVDGAVGDSPSSLEAPKSTPDTHKPGEVKPRDWIGTQPTSMDAKTGSSSGINGRASDPALEKLDLTESVVKIELDLETSTLSVLEGEDDPSANMKPKSILGAGTGDYKFGKFPIKERASFLTPAQGEYSHNRQGPLIFQRRRSDMGERKDSILLTDSMLNLRRVPGMLNNPFMKVKQFGKPGQGLLSPPRSSSSGQAKPVASETFISSGNSFRLNTFSGSLEPPPHILQSEDTETNVIGEQEMQHSSFNYPMSREGSKPTSEKKSYLSSSSGTSLNMRKIPYPPLIKLENTSIIQENKVFTSLSEKEKMGLSARSSARSGNVFPGGNPPVLIIDLNKMRHGQPLQGSTNTNCSLSFRVGDMKSSSAGGFDMKNRMEAPDAHASKVGLSSTSHLIGPSANFTAPQKNHEVHDKVILPNLFPKQLSSRNESVLVSRQQMGLPNVINMSASKAIHVNIIKDINQASQIMRKNPISDPANTVNFSEKEGSITEKLDFPIRLPPNMLALVNPEPRKAFVKLGGNPSEDNSVSSDCDKSPVANYEHGLKENKRISNENHRAESLVSLSEFNVAQSKSWPKEVTVNIDQSKLSLVSSNIPVSASETPVSKGESYIMKSWPSGLVGTSNESTALQNISCSKEIKNSTSDSKNSPLPKSSTQGVSILREPKKLGNNASLGTVSSSKLSSAEEGTACGKSQSKGKTENLSPMKVQQSGRVKEMEGVAGVLANIQVEKPVLASGLADVGDPVRSLEGNRTAEKRLECSDEGSSNSLRSTQFIGIINDKESEVDELPRKEAILITSSRRSRYNSKSKRACKKEARASCSGIKEKVVHFTPNSPAFTFDTSHSTLQSAKKASDQIIYNASHSTPQEGVVSRKKTSTEFVKIALLCTSEKADSVAPRKKTSFPEKSFSVSSRKKAVTQLTCDGLPSTPQKAIMLSPKKASTPSPVKVSALSSPKKGAIASPVKGRVSSPRKTSTPSPVKAQVSSPRRALTLSPKNAPSESAPSQDWKLDAADTGASLSSAEKARASTISSLARDEDSLGQNAMSKDTLSPQREEAIKSKAPARSPGKTSLASSSPENDEKGYYLHLSPCESADPAVSAPPSPPPSSLSKKKASPNHSAATEEKCFKVPLQQVSLLKTSSEECQSVQKVCAPPATIQATSPASSGIVQRGDESLAVPPSSSTASSPDEPQDLPSNMDVVWYRLSLNGEFDKLISDETGFSTSASRLLSAVMIARTSNRTVRLAFDKKKNSEESQEFKKGIYAVPTVCGSYVKIGPYKHNEPTGVRTLKKVGNHQYKVVPNLLKIDVDTHAGDSLLDNEESSSSVESPGPGKANKTDVSSLPMDSAVVSNIITSKQPHVKSGTSKANEKPLVPVESENNAETSCAASSPEKKHVNIPLKIPVLSIPRISLDYEKRTSNAGEREKKLMESRPSTKVSSLADSKLEAVVVGEKCDELSHAVREVCGISNRKQKDDISPVVHAAKKQCTNKEAIVPTLSSSDSHLVMVGKNLKSTQQVQVAGDGGSSKLDSGNQAIKDTRTTRKENRRSDKSEPLQMDVSDKCSQNDKKKAVAGTTGASVSTDSEGVQVKDMDAESEAEVQRDMGSTGEDPHSGASSESGQIEIMASMKNDSTIEIDESKFESGYLIPNIPKLAPYPVKRSAGLSDSFSYVIEDLSEKGSYARFEDLETVGQHMNEVLHNYVRFFPPHFQIEWTYAKDIPSAPGTIKIKSLTKDQFITYKGVFRYLLGEDMSSKLNKLLHDNVEMKTVTCKYSRALEEAKAQLLAILAREGSVPAGVMDTLAEVIDKALGEISSLRSHDELLSEDSVFMKKKHRELLEKLQGLLKDYGVETYAEFERMSLAKASSKKEELSETSETNKTPEGLGARGRGIKRGRGRRLLKEIKIKEQEETEPVESNICQKVEANLSDSKEGITGKESSDTLPSRRRRVLKSLKATSPSVLSKTTSLRSSNRSVLAAEGSSKTRNLSSVLPETTSAMTAKSPVVSSGVLSSAAKNIPLVPSENSDKRISEVVPPINCASSAVGSAMVMVPKDKTSASPVSEPKSLSQEGLNCDNRLGDKGLRTEDSTQRTSGHVDASADGQPESGEAKPVDALLWRRSFSRVKLDQSATKRKDKGPPEMSPPRQLNSRLKVEQKLRASGRCLEASTVLKPTSPSVLSKKRKS